jgi:hypothetical protein
MEASIPSERLDEVKSVVVTQQEEEDLLLLNKIIVGKSFVRS